MTQTRVLLADDHKIVVEGLRSLLRSEFDLIGTCENGAELVEAAERLRPDVIVADISMPILNGIDAVRKLRQSDLDTKVVFLTMHPDVVFATRALDAGASGYVLKHSASDELITAIHTVLRGDVFISDALRNPALDEFLDPSKRHVKTTIDLTGRQREVLQLVAEGRSAKEIAGILNISSRTVETHKYKIMDELGARTTAELVQHAIKHGLITG
jgi:DNA-binding NarL/FixJ family response regulator